MNKLVKSTYTSLLKNIGSALQQGKVKTAYSKSTCSSIYQTLSGVLSWSDNSEPLSITNDLAKSNAKILSI
jgi:hypothetical protein